MPIVEADLRAALRVQAFETVASASRGRFVGGTATIAGPLDC